ncbi:portal protein [Haloferax tailed virus 1]|uniref:Portal protein n=1 Tax=Haloferax tailed virus 1 TaxID=2507575 RepID=A0A410N6Q2_HFTV1|nr:portal protein [Haloferax tailed virus 1]QAS68846.1 portal protein [Haloferax tailed virus 1]
MPKYNLRIGNRRVPIASTDTPLSEAIGKRLASSTPQTNVDSMGGGHSYQFNGQDLTFEDLRDIKDVRDSGGQVAQLMDYKALLNFGEGCEIHVEGDDETKQLVDGEPMTLSEWLEDAFPHLDLLVLDLGGDALWYPYAVGEIQETITGEFKEALPAEPWTLMPESDAQGKVQAWHQRTKTHGGYQTQTLPADDLWHIVINKASARDEVGISEVLRNKDEIQAFKQNEAAINQAIELHGFPQRHVKVGKEDGAPVRDNDLRRVRTIFDPRTTDANTAYFTGQDVDVETLEAHNFDYSAIHEMDMRNLTTALGLPLEAGNVGADGLGSGKPAELRFALLKLAIKANQRSFSVQFVERVMRPVVRDYSPFDHEADIRLEINDPLEDIGEVADLIQQVGDYMTNEQVAEKLDLPAPEDDEVADSYRSPADMEKDEAGVQDEPFGGMFAGRDMGNRCLGEGITDDELQHAPEWDRPLLEMYQGVTNPESDTSRTLVSFSSSGTPEFVLERIRESIMDGALFSEFDNIPSSRLMELRQTFADELGTDNFTLDSITDALMDFEADLTRDAAERIARTESSAVLNHAREISYEERGEGNELFYWTGADLGDSRQTEACAWLIRQTNPFSGGTPVPMNELRDMVDEAPSHDDSMDNNLARPDSWVVHPNERSSFVKAPPNWEQL